MTATQIPDGTYYLHPEGSAWIAARAQNGRIEATYAQDADSHAAAGDSWGGVVPSDDDREVPAALALALIREIMGDDTDPELVVVTWRSTTDHLVCGLQVQIDRSGGQGHCWRNISAQDLPATIREEIECEIIDGDNPEHDHYVGSNGLHYRWA